jgi:hypothetical protein
MNRLRASLSFVALAIAGFAAGCAGVSVRASAAPDANLAGIKTYAFHPSSAQQGQPASPASQQIQASLQRNLAEKGLKEATDGNPDVLVAYHTTAEQKTEVTPGWGYGYDYWGWGGYPEVTSYTEGTIIVDLVNPHTNKVVWRGTAVGVINHPNNPNPQKIDKAVSKLMTQYPSLYASTPQRVM